ncbi:MAG: hypothetical protein AABZ74_02985 [Cyanobacteriota bacterium]
MKRLITVFTFIFVSNTPVFADEKKKTSDSILKKEISNSKSEDNSKNDHKKEEDKKVDGFFWEDKEPLKMNINIDDVSNMFMKNPNNRNNNQTNNAFRNSNYIYGSIGGIIFSDFSKLNTYLDERGYNTFNNQYFILGTGRRTVFGRFLQGSELTFLVGNIKLAPKNGINLAISSNINANFNLGYVLYAKNNLQIYPSVGLGIQRLSIDISKEEADAKTNFEDILKNPGSNSSSVSKNTAMIDLGLGAEYVFKLAQNTDNEIINNIQNRIPVSFLLGIKSGYVIDMFSLDGNGNILSGLFSGSLTGNNILGGKSGGVKGSNNTSVQQTVAKINDIPEINSNGFYIKVYGGFSDNILFNALIVAREEIIKLFQKDDKKINKK